MCPRAWQKSRILPLGSPGPPSSTALPVLGMATKTMGMLSVDVAAMLSEGQSEETQVLPLDSGQEG